MVSRPIIPPRLVKTATDTTVEDSVPLALVLSGVSVEGAGVFWEGGEIFGRTDMVGVWPELCVMSAGLNPIPG